jgi:DNA polymerase III delta prime subunit|tara:strand:+ start:18844 stop:19773 length:930 start_codon:yes stop_codon:yes gene_type:complete
MFGNQENTLWVEKFRPGTLDGYVGNEHIIEKVKLYLKSGDVPHLLFYGGAGTGKTTLAKIIANNVDADVMYVNASDENNIETVRTKIKNYASTVGFRQWKIVILDEADYMTPNGQAALRNLMETFSKTTRFILTCNYVEKIIDPIQSRCQVFGITPPNKTEVAKRIVTILNELQVQYDTKDIATTINAGYPDIRRVLNSCQRQVVDGKLIIDDASLVQANYMSELLELLQGDQSKGDTFKNIRQLIANSKVQDFTSLHKFLFDEIDNYAKGHLASVILILAESQYQDAFAVDKELHMMSTMIKLLNELK